jgi:hypothetical protein
VHIAITLTMRNRCVRPQGTAGTNLSALSAIDGEGMSYCVCNREGTRAGHSIE